MKFIGRPPKKPKCLRCGSRQVDFKPISRNEYILEDKTTGKKHVCGAARKIRTKRTRQHKRDQTSFQRRLESLATQKLAQPALLTYGLQEKAGGFLSSRVVNGTSNEPEPPW